MLLRLPLLVALAFTTLCFAEDPRRSLSVLKTTDSSGLEVGEKIQAFYATSLSRSPQFDVKTKSVTLAGYSNEQIDDAFSHTGTQLMSFAYIDKDRVALFLFDSHRPGKYVATSQSLAGSPSNRITDQWIANCLTKAMNELIRNYTQASFEDIPGAKKEDKITEPELSRDERGRRLFKELSKLQEGAVYLGANLGMARFSAQGVSSSVVSFGGYFGIKLYDRLRLEAGMDIFSYLLSHLDARVQLPFGERYVSLYLGMGLNHITALVTQNRGFNPTFLRTGELLYGPSIGFDVPLLGASVRGDVRLLLGSATVIMATYGLAYTL